MIFLTKERAVYSVYISSDVKSSDLAVRRLGRYREESIVC